MDSDELGVLSEHLQTIGSAAIHRAVDVGYVPNLISLFGSLHSSSICHVSVRQSERKHQVSCRPWLAGMPRSLGLLSLIHGQSLAPIMIWLLIWLLISSSPCTPRTVHGPCLGIGVTLRGLVTRNTHQILMGRGQRQPAMSQRLWLQAQTAPGIPNPRGGHGRSNRIQSGFWSWTLYGRTSV